MAIQNFRLQKIKNEDQVVNNHTELKFIHITKFEISIVKNSSIKNFI